MAFQIVILSCLLAFVSAGPQLGWQESFAPRVVGGEDAEVGEFPHQVSLQTGYNYTSLKHFCGGSIIDENWILTAGHCVHEEQGNSLFVIKAGKHNISEIEDYEQVRRVAKSFVHESYVGDVAPYDIALLKLETPLAFNQRVAAINLPKPDEEPSQLAFVSGWGLISNSEFPDILQKAILPIIDLATCNDAINQFFGYSIHETNICTGPLTGGRDACGADSGGPLTSKTDNGDKVIGVVSWGFYPCGSANLPSVFVKVSKFIDWIQNIIDNNNY